MNAGFSHLGTTFREGQSVNSESVSHGQHNAVQLTTAVQLLLRLLHSGKNLLGSLTTPLFAHVVPIGREGR